MIVSRIWAGLGNQLFQYAAGRCLAMLHNVPLKLDCRWYGMSIPGDTPRRYALEHFRIEAEEVSAEELKKFPFTRVAKTKLCRSFLPRWQLFLQKTKHTSQLNNYRERHFHFDSRFFNLPPQVYLIGYFQSERYFKPIEETLRREFSFKTPPIPENQQLLDRIQNDASAISLHIRRGDYALDQRIRRHHGLCDLTYYQTAIKEMTARVNNPCFYVFSDDIPWAKAHLPASLNCIFVSRGQTSPPHEDLRLMQHCRHHILANSSFSWWGAWLNPRGDKIVFAPKTWALANLDFSDLLPPGWAAL